MARPDGSLVWRGGGRGGGLCPTGSTSHVEGLRKGPRASRSTGGLWKIRWAAGSESGQLLLMLQLQNQSLCQKPVIVGLGSPLMELSPIPVPLEDPSSRQKAPGRNDATHLHLCRMIPFQAHAGGRALGLRMGWSWSNCCPGNLQPLTLPATFHHFLSMRVLCLRAPRPDPWEPSKRQHQPRNSRPQLWGPWSPTKGSCDSGRFTPFPGPPLLAQKEKTGSRGSLRSSSLSFPVLLRCWSSWAHAQYGHWTGKGAGPLEWPAIGLRNWTLPFCV